jgi:hypothetical protein
MEMAGRGMDKVLAAAAHFPGYITIHDITMPMFVKGEQRFPPHYHARCKSFSQLTAKRSGDS